MRILLVADFYPPAPGGLEAHVRRLALALNRNGNEVAVVAGGAGGIRDPGVTVHHAGLSLDRIPGAYRRSGRAFHPPWPDRTFQQDLSRVLADFAPDVVHAHGWCQFSASAACAGRWPVVVTLHDHGLRCPKKNLLRGTRECASGRGLRCLSCPGEEQGTAKRAVLGTALASTVPRLDARVRRFIAVCGHVADRFLEAGSDPARVTVIANFLDMPAGDFVEPTGRDVVYIGPSDRHKGLSVLLTAGHYLPPGLARLVVVGAPGSQDGVEFTGRLTGEALWQRFRAAALVVIPSIWPEPCPTVALEALGYGRPIVASRTGGLTDLVAHGRTGLLVRPGDPRGLAAAITELLNDRTRLSAMARAAHDSAGAFDTVPVVARIEAVYKEVLAEW